MGWSSDEQAVFRHGDWKATLELISRKRRWVNLVETQTVGEAVAFTVEPRAGAVGSGDLPMATYHTIVVFDNGQKRWLTGFDELFKLVGMDYMLGIAD